MQPLLCAATVALGGCAGIQGGSEGTPGPCGLVDTEPLADPDAIPRAFERAPREIFAVVAGRYEGTLAVPNAGVSLELQPKYELLSASYYRNEQVSGCAPWIELPVTVSLATVAGTTATPGTALTFRADGPEATATFVVAANTPLAALTPAFSGPLIEAPTLDIHLYRFVDGTVSSDWFWRAVVCPTNDACTGGAPPGYPQPGRQSEEIPWSAVLTRP